VKPRGAREGELMAGNKGATKRKSADKSKLAERTLEHRGVERLTGPCPSACRASTSTAPVGADRFSRLVLFLFRKRCCRRLPGLTVGGTRA